MQNTNEARKLTDRKDLMSLCLTEYTETKGDYDFHRNNIHTCLNQPVYLDYFQKARTLALELMNREVKLAWGVVFGICEYDTGYAKIKEFEINDSYLIRAGCEMAVSVETKTGLTLSKPLSGKDAITRLYQLTANEDGRGYFNDAGEKVLDFAFIRNQIKNHIVDVSGFADFEVEIDTTKYLHVVCKYRQPTSDDQHLVTHFKIDLSV